MTGTLNSADLLPCPFCGTQPKLPDGDGTQYEIWCEDCGGAVAAVQICDLMTLEERASDSLTNYRYGEEFIERAKLEAIGKWNRRPQPAEQQDEPVAYRVRYLCPVEGPSGWFYTPTVQSIMDRPYYEVAPLYHRPAAQAVKIEMADVVRATMGVDGCPVLTSNQCYAVAQKLNAQIKGIEP